MSFSVENRNVSHPRVFNALAEGVLLELGIDAMGQIIYDDGATRRSKKF